MHIRTLSSMHTLAVLVAAAGLAACAPMQGGQDHPRHHPGRSVDAMAPAVSGMHHGRDNMMGASSAGATGSMAPADREAMCARYRGMRDAPDERARQAMMDREMASMPPEMRRRHMEMMGRHCQ